MVQTKNTFQVQKDIVKNNGTFENLNIAGSSLVTSLTGNVLTGTNTNTLSLVFAEMWSFGKFVYYHFRVTGDENAAGTTNITIQTSLPIMKNYSSPTIIPVTVVENNTNMITSEARSTVDVIGGVDYTELSVSWTATGIYGFVIDITGSYISQ